MASHDVTAQAESDAATVFLSRIKWDKDIGYHIGGDGSSVIGYVDEFFVLRSL